ncbi:MAG TPA: PAS domain S-box protein [Dehalococcoidales bacterium]|nr:PAS domain S-box protein [Dehalococcoidales bacterium]
MKKQQPKKEQLIKGVSGIGKAVKYSPLIIASIYIIISLIYIVSSDWIVAWLITDVSVFSRIQTLKGIGFVVISSLVLYFSIRSSLNKVFQSNVALSQAEEKVRSIFESMTDGIVVFDTRNKIVEVNGAFTAMMGYASRSEIMGKNIFTFFPVQEHSRLRQEFNNIVDSGNSAVFELTIDKDGKGQFPARMSVSILKQSDGSLQGMVAFIEDITERKQAQSQLEELYNKEKSQREELQEESKARGMFIDVLAHELRTPLTPIVASSGMLKDHLVTSDDEISRKLNSNILDGTDTLTRRLEELLDIGRVSRGTFALTRLQVNTSYFLTETINRLKPVISKKSQRLKMIIPPALPLVNADPLRLEQAIYSLTTMAAKASPPDSDIIFTAGVAERVIYLEITAQGPGISDEELSRLFSPYHRTEQDRQKYPGIGLGLAMAKHIVEAHGGTIKAVSRPGRGSLFRIEIPF